METNNKGKESFEIVFSKKTGEPLYKYTYVHSDGDVFTGVASTLDKCRTKRDEWLGVKNAEVLDCECTCNSNSDACHACKSDNNQRYGGDIPYDGK